MTKLEKLLLKELEARGIHSPSCAVKAWGGFPDARWTALDRTRCTCSLGEAIKAARRRPAPAKEGA